MKESIIITEEKRNQLQISKYSLNEKLIKIIENKDERKIQSVSQSLTNWLQDVFLPQGYPHSVTPDYFEFQLWDSLQAFSSYISNSLTLNTVLKGLGVGEESASSTAAVLTWLVKDGVGMVSSIGFAYWKATELDSNGKQWRLFADVVNDCTFFVNLMSPFLPVPFWMTLSFSSILVSLVGVSGSATRASAIQHLAKRDNMADLSAKERSQETIVNLLGLFVSLTIVPLVAKSSILTWIIFLMSVMFHLFCNYKAMKSLRLTSLNRLRLVHALRKWTTEGVIPTVDEGNLQEPLLLWPAFSSHFLTSSMNLYIGGSLQDVQKHCSNPEQYLFSHNNGGNQTYFLFPNDDDTKLYLILSKTAASEDILIGFLASYLYAVNKENCNALLSNFSIDKTSSQLELVKAAEIVARRECSKFSKELQLKGWIVDNMKLNTDEWRINIGKKSN